MSQCDHAPIQALRTDECLMCFRSRVSALEAENGKLREAATKWPRCCDLWQDSLGEMHCTECAQKTFAMMRAVQGILGVRKDCTSPDGRDGGATKPGLHPRGTVTFDPDFPDGPSGTERAP